MKDRLGHGSNPRGVSAVQARNDRMHAMFERAKAQGHTGLYSGPAKPTAAPDAAHQAGTSKVGALPLESNISRDLRLFADNDANLNRQSLQPIRDNLGKKMDKGTYDPQKAEKLWSYHADRAAQAYAQQHGTGQDWHKMFSPAVRREAAAHWERDERSDIKSGSSRTYKG